MEYSDYGVVVKRSRFWPEGRSLDKIGRQLRRLVGCGCNWLLLGRNRVLFRTTHYVNDFRATGARQLSACFASFFSWKVEGGIIASSKWAKEEGVTSALAVAGGGSPPCFLINRSCTKKNTGCKRFSRLHFFFCAMFMFCKKHVCFGGGFLPFPFEDGQRERALSSGW